MLDCSVFSRIRNAKVAGSTPVLGNSLKPLLAQDFDGFSLLRFLPKQLL